MLKEKFIAILLLFCYKYTIRKNIFHSNIILTIEIDLFAKMK